MNCETIKERIIDYIDGSLDIQVAREVDEHLSSCEECRKELLNTESIWQGLDALEIEPISGNVKKNIENMIDSYNLAVNTSKKTKPYTAFSKWVDFWWPGRPLVQFAITVAVVIISFITGLAVNSISQSHKEIARLKTDMNNLQYVVMNSLFNESSAVERISGLTMTGRLKNVDNEFYSTLLLILNSDSNVNVRLAAVDALANFTDNEYVRRELVKSLGLQSSPLVQVSLIDLLTKIREPESTLSLLRIINDPDTNTHVKEQAQKALKQFI